MTKEEIIKMLNTREISSKKCAYCGEEIVTGFFNGNDFGKRVVFPKIFLERFTTQRNEIVLHYRCVQKAVNDMIREGGFDIDEKDTKVLIRY